MATAVIKDHASQKRRNFISKFLIYFFLIVITACMLLPFLWMLSSSFKLNKDVFGFPIQWIPKNPRWQNYVDIWTQIPLLTFVKTRSRSPWWSPCCSCLPPPLQPTPLQRCSSRAKTRSSSLHCHHRSALAGLHGAPVHDDELVAFEQHPSGHYVPAGLQCLRRVPDEAVLRGRAH